MKLTKDGSLQLTFGFTPGFLVGIGGFGFDLSTECSTRMIVLHLGFFNLAFSRTVL